MIKILALSVAVATGSSAVAQEFTNMKSTDVGAEEWKLEGERTMSEVIEMLSSQGWSSSAVTESLPATDKFKLYSRTPAPGIKTFLAVPSDGAPPIEYSPYRPGPGRDFYQAGLFDGPSAEEIREEIISGMQAAIDALCEMRARPQTIRAQASAFGVVEVEATWNAAEVCER